MDCTKIREQMTEAKGGEAMAELQAHTAQCPSCAKEWQEMRSLMLLLDEWQAPEPSPFFATRLNARVQEAKAEESISIFGWMHRPAFGMPLWRPMVAGVLALAAAVGLGMYQLGTPKPDQTAAVVQQKSLAVRDLEALDKNHELYANIDLLDDISSTADHSKDQI